MTGIIRIGVTERGSFKKHSKAVHIGVVPEYMSSRTHFAKIEDKKLLRKISSKNLTAVFFLNFFGASNLDS